MSVNIKASVDPISARDKYGIRRFQSKRLSSYRYHGLTHLLLLSYTPILMI
jgi:hypothetical protein